MTILQFIIYFVQYTKANRQILDYFYNSQYFIDKYQLQLLLLELVFNL